MSYQVEMVTLDQLIDKNHNYRKFKKLWDLEPVKKELKQIEDARGAELNPKFQNIKKYFSILCNYLLHKTIVKLLLI